MRTETDTSQRSEIADGTWVFRVVEVREHIKGQTKMYIWKLEYDNGNQGEQVLLPNMMGDLLRLLDCKEEKPNRFVWDTDEVVGDTFKATVTHEMDKKGIRRQQMTAFVDDDSDVPF